MVADFSQLDQDVFVVGDRIALFYALLLEQVTVYRLLLFGNSHVDMDFNLWLEREFHLFLDSSQ